MNGKMNILQLHIVKEYEFDKLFFHEIVCIIDSFIRDCHNKYFHTFVYECVYDIKLTKIGNSEITNLTITDKSVNFYELNKNVQIAQQKGFIFIEKIISKRKFNSSLSNTNVGYYLNFRIPITHREFFRIISQKPEYVKTHCNARKNPFHFASRIWIFYNHSP